MALSGGSQAHHKAQTGWGCVALVRVGHDRGVEDGGGFQRIFAGEQRADKLLPFVRERTLREDVREDLLVIPPEERLDSLMPPSELLTHCVQMACRLIFRESQDAADNGGDTVNVASRLEALTRTLDATIIASDPLARRVRGESGDALLDGFVAGTPQALRNRTEPMGVWMLRVEE